MELVLGGGIVVLKGLIKGLHLILLDAREDAIAACRSLTT